MLRPGTLLRKGASNPRALSPKPTSEIDFSRVGSVADLPAGSTFARTSGATRLNHRGYIEEVAANVMRPSYDPALEYNHLLNPWLSGAVLGVLGSGGALPTGWSANATLSIEVMALGDDGVAPYMDLRYFGTPTVGTQYTFMNQNTDILSPPAGSIWTVGCGLALVGGDFTNVSLFTLRLLWGPASSQGPTYTSSLTSTVQEYTLTPGGITGVPTFMQALFRITPTVGQPHDFTVRHRFPRLTQNSTDIIDRIPIASLVARKNGVPQHGLEGVLLEAGATNLQRNVRMEGWTAGVVGSGGVLPTNMSISGAGFSVEVFGIVYLNGIPFLDVGFTAAAGAAVTGLMELDTVGSAPMTGSTPYVPSIYAALIGGTLNDTTLGIRVRVDTVTPANGFAVSLNTIISTPTRGDTFSYTTAATATAGHLQIQWTTTVAGGFARLLLGGPQLEQGNVATSLILPPVGVPGVSTRANDNLSFPTSMMADFATGSMSVRARRHPGNAYTAAKYGPTIAAGTTANMATFHWANSGFAPRYQINSGGTNVAFLVDPYPGQANWHTGAMSWGGGSSLISWGGNDAVEDITAPSPVGAATAVQGNGADGTALSSAHFVLQYLRLWSGVKLTASQLKSEGKKITITEPPVPPPTTSIDFMVANTVADLPAGSTFTRASVATRINASGATEEVGANVMRIQHDVGGVRLGVLLEEATTNALVDARDLSVWTQTGLVYAAAAAAAPNGLTEATRITEAVQTSTHFGSHATISAVAAAGEKWTFSIFVKPETATFVQLILPSGSFGTTNWINYDLVAGVLGTNGGAALSGAIVRHANGWFRLVITSTSTGATQQTPAVAIVQSASSARIPSYAGTGLSALIWGAQFEKSPFPTSVILPPAGAPAVTTRARDAMALPPSLALDTLGTMSARVAMARNGSPGMRGIAPIITLDDGGTTNYVALRTLENGNATMMYETGGNLGGSTIYGTNIPSDTFQTFCGSWGLDSAIGAYDGGFVEVFNGTGNFKTFTRFSLNGTPTSTNGPNVIIKYLRLWKGIKMVQPQIKAESGRTS